MKLGTKEIKKLISQWVSSPDIRERLIDTEEFDEKQQEILWKKWCDGSRWKRSEKERLGDEWETYMTDYDYSSAPPHPAPVPKMPYFMNDFAGAHDNDLLLKYFSNPAEARLCIHRCFVPCSEFDDNYRIEVITTPEDDAVIGWTIIVD